MRLKYTTGQRGRNCRCVRNHSLRASAQYFITHLLLLYNALCPQHKPNALPCPVFPNPTTTTPTQTLWNRAQHEQDYTELQRTITYRTGHRDPHNRYWSPVDSGYHRYMSQDLNNKNGGSKPPHCVGLWGGRKGTSQSHESY